MTAFCNARVMHPVRSALPFGYFLSKKVLTIVAVSVADSIYLESREVFVVVADHIHYDICARRFLTIIKHVKLSRCVADN